MWDEDQNYTEEDREEDIYSDKEAEELLEDDEIMTREEAFMKGYDLDFDNSTEIKKCKTCGYEVDIDDKVCPVCGAGLRTTQEV